VLLQKFDAVARWQHGIITRKQSLQIATDHQIESLLRRNLIETIRRGVYRMQGSPDSWEQRLAAVVLSHERYVASHYSAARLHALGNHWQRDVLEVSTHQSRRHSLTDVIVHKAPLSVEHIAVVKGIRTTTIARTLVDLAATSPAAAIERAFDHALSMRLIVVKDVEDVLDAVARPGRPNIAIAERMVAARQEHLSHSDLERKAFTWIAAAGLPAPEAQFPVPTRHCPYDIDLAYPDAKVAIECGGFTFHGNRTAYDRDAQRNSALAALGWRLLAVTTRTREHDFIADLRIALRTAA
jgi:very-short-patch-repair endonuclease